MTFMMIMALMRIMALIMLIIDDDDEILNHHHHREGDELSMTFPSKCVGSLSSQLNLSFVRPSRPIAVTI